MLLISQRHCTLQRQTSCALHRATDLVRLGLALSVLAQEQSWRVAGTFSSAHRAPTPRGGCPVPGSVGAQGRLDSRLVSGMGEMAFWSLGKAFSSTARKQPRAMCCARLCPGLPRGCGGMLGTPGAGPSAVTALLQQHKRSACGPSSRLWEHSRRCSTLTSTGSD